MEFEIKKYLKHEMSENGIYTETKIVICWYDLLQVTFSIFAMYIVCATDGEI